MSKGGGGTSIPSSTTTQVILPDWVNAQAQKNIASANALASQGYTADPYAGVAPLTPLQQSAYNLVGANLGSTAPTFNQAISNVQNLPQTTQSLLNPYLTDVENAAVSNIQRQGALAGQQLAGSAVGQGAFGGTRYGIEQALNASETQRNIGQTVAGIESQGWNTATQQALAQAQEMGALASGGQNALLQGAQAAVGAGGAEQTQQQAVINNQVQQWEAQQQWPYQQLAIQEGALSGTPYGTSTTNTQQYNQNRTANTMGNIAADVGLGSSLYNLGSGLFSSGGLFGSQGALFGSTGLFGSSGALSGLFGGGGVSAEALASAMAGAGDIGTSAVLGAAALA